MSRQLGFGQEVPVAGALHADAGKLPSAGELAQSGQLANFSFGQGGLLASPVQIAAMMNTMLPAGCIARLSLCVARWMKLTVRRWKRLHIRSQGRVMRCGKCSAPT